MSDQFKPGGWSELKRLAEAATPGPWGRDGSYVCPVRVEGGTTYIESWRAIADSHHLEDVHYIAAANPTAILALIAENERLQNLACAVNSAMHAAGMPVGADPAELADVIHGLQVQVATLQSAPNSWQSGYDKGRADGTRARLSELEQERRINAELRAEVEALQDAIKDMVFAMQVNPSCQMGVVERCRCWFCAIGRTKTAMRKDNPA